MAITAADIHNQSFSIDRKGYDVDEVDVFLEHVADEIDGLNQQIASLQSQIGEDTFAGFDRPATFDDEVFDEPEPEHAAEQDDQPADSIDPAILAEKDAAIAERDARIAELEKQLESKKADGNAIAQALIIAQRSADEIVAKANAQAAETIQDARDEASRILNRANDDKQAVLDSIRKLEDEREDVREEYQDILKDFIADASRKLADLGGVAVAATSFAGGFVASQATGQVFDDDATGEFAIDEADDVYDEPAAAVEYTTPQTTDAVVAAATPVASAYEKDLSGFGDADDFEFEEVD